MTIQSDATQHDEAVYYLPVGGAARLAGVAEVTIRRLCDAGKLRYVKTDLGHRLIRSDDAERLGRLRGKAIRTRVLERAEEILTDKGVPLARARESLQRKFGPSNE